MAERLGLPAHELRRKLRPKDFLLYREYILGERKSEFDKEWKERHRSDYYMAQIAWEVYLLRHVVGNMFATRPTKPELTFNKFLFDFMAEDKKPEVVDTRSEEAKYLQRVVDSAIQKNDVAMFLGVTVPN